MNITLKNFGQGLLLATLFCMPGTLLPKIDCGTMVDPKDGKTKNLEWDENLQQCRIRCSDHDRSDDDKWSYIQNKCVRANVRCNEDGGTWWGASCDGGSVNWPIYLRELDIAKKTNLLAAATTVYAKANADAEHARQNAAKPQQDAKNAQALLDILIKKGALQSTIDEAHAKAEDAANTARNAQAEADNLAEIARKAKQDMDDATQAVEDAKKPCTEGQLRDDQEGYCRQNCGANTSDAPKWSYIEKKCVSAEKRCNENGGKWMGKSCQGGDINTAADRAALAVKLAREKEQEIAKTIATAEKTAQESAKKALTAGEEAANAQRDLDKLNASSNPTPAEHKRAQSRVDTAKKVLKIAQEQATRDFNAIQTAMTAAQQAYDAIKAAGQPCKPGQIRDDKGGFCRDNCAGSCLVPHGALCKWSYVQNKCISAEDRCHENNCQWNGLSCTCGKEDCESRGGTWVGFSCENWLHAPVDVEGRKEQDVTISTEEAKKAHEEEAATKKAADEQEKIARKAEDEADALFDKGVTGQELQNAQAKARAERDLADQLAAAAGRALDATKAAEQKKEHAGEKCKAGEIRDERYGFCRQRCDGDQVLNSSGDKYSYFSHKCTSAETRCNEEGGRWIGASCSHIGKEHIVAPDFAVQFQFTHSIPADDELEPGGIDLYIFSEPGRWYSMQARLGNAAKAQGIMATAEQLAPVLGSMAGEEGAAAGAAVGVIAGYGTKLIPTINKLIESDRAMAVKREIAADTPVTQNIDKVYKTIAFVPVGKETGKIYGVYQVEPQSHVTLDMQTGITTNKRGKKIKQQQFVVTRCLRITGTDKWKDCAPMDKLITPQGSDNVYFVANPRTPEQLKKEAEKRKKMDEELAAADADSETTDTKKTHKKGKKTTATDETTTDEPATTKEPASQSSDKKPKKEKASTPKRTQS